jgi:hypothetical protein
MGRGGRGDGAYGRVGGRRADLIGDGSRTSRDAVKGRSAKVGFVWPLAYALFYFSCINMYFIILLAQTQSSSLLSCHI